MRKTIGKLWIVLLLAASIAACERDGIEPGGTYRQLEFTPISNVESSQDYGTVTFIWEKPDSSSSLLYTTITWATPEGDEEQLKVPRNVDSVVLDDLATFEYTFGFRSYADNGEGADVAAVTLSVEDWLQEPPAQVEDFVFNAAENLLLLNWNHPVQRTYEKVVFEVYEGENLVLADTVAKSEESEARLELAYTTAYRLVYYSLNARNIRSEKTELPFATGDWAPIAPAIVLDKSRIDYAHSGDITWTTESDTDSLRISFRDLNGETRVYYLDATTGKGYLSLLPGGKVSVSVQALGETNTWSIPVVSELTTRKTTELYRLRHGNAPNSANLSKLSERFYFALGHGSYDDYKANPNSAYYAFAEMATLTSIELAYEILQIDELELLVNLETLIVASSSPGEATCPSVEEFLKVADRCPRLNILRVNPGYPRYAALQAAFANHPKVTFE